MGLDTSLQGSPGDEIICVIDTVAFSLSSPSFSFSIFQTPESLFRTMQHTLFIYFFLGSVLRYPRAYSDLLLESYDDDLFSGDELIDSMQSDELITSVIGSDVGPVALDETIDVDQSLMLLANFDEDCSSFVDSPDLLLGKIRARGERCTSRKSSPPPPKLDQPSLQLPKEPDPQMPFLWGFPTLPPFPRYPNCQNKMPCCCPSGKKSDNTYPDCKICEETRSSP